jgi:hypothetical protein
MEFPSTESGVQRIVDLVHRRDVLMNERAKVTANLDAEIAKIDSALSAASGIISPEPSASPRQVRLNLGVRPGTYAEKVLLHLARNPQAALGEIAADVYGDDSHSSRHKVRAVIWSLKDKGRLPKTAEVSP